MLCYPPTYLPCVSYWDWEEGELVGWLILESSCWCSRKRWVSIEVAFRSCSFNIQVLEFGIRLELFVIISYNMIRKA